MPEARIAQIDGKINSIDAEDASSAGNRLSDSEEIQASRPRGGVQANTVRNIAFLGRKKGRQPVWVDVYIAGLAEYTIISPMLYCLTTYPRFGHFFTKPSDAKTRSASRTGLRLTLNLLQSSASVNRCSGG